MANGAAKHHPVLVGVGPAQLGTLYNIDMYGLRGGGFGAVPWYENHTREMLFPFPFSLFDSGMDIAGFGEERFCYQSRSTPALRGKGYIARVPFPLIGVANQPEYYTQFELFLGVFGTLRLGFNPGELLDFLLGWSTIDIYSDDLEKQKSKRRSQKSGTGAADPRP